MKTKSVLKIWLIAIVVAVYFVISLSVIDMPYKMEWIDTNLKTEYQWDEKKLEIFHSKVFGDIEIHRGLVYVECDNCILGYKTSSIIAPKKMLILNFINWYKACLVILLFSFIASLLKYTYGSVAMMMITIFYGGFTLYDKSPNYGFSEILILILFLVFLTMQIGKKIKAEEKPEFRGYRKMPENPEWPGVEMYELIDKNDHTSSPMFIKLKKDPNWSK